MDTTLDWLGRRLPSAGRDFSEAEDGTERSVQEQEVLISVLRRLALSAAASPITRIKIMFISKFCRLGVRAMRSPAARALPFSSVVSYSMAHNPFLRTQRHISFFGASDKLGSEEEDVEPERINVTFVDKDGKEKHVKVPVGFSMLEAAVDNDIDMEGTCEGTMACSTCHVIVLDVDQYNKLPDPCEEENDMLDLTMGLTTTSRLGCQIIATPELDGLRLALPAHTRSIMV